MMDIIEALFKLGIPLLLIYVLYQSKRELVHINRIFHDLSRRYHGTLSRRTWFDYPSLAITHQGSTFHLTVSLATGGNVWVTRLHMGSRMTMPVKIQVLPENGMERFATRIGFQDCQFEDPEFDPDERAFYYARVIEIPTPRWVLYDKVRLGAKIPEEAELIGQERAYTSPIWYTP